MNQNMIRQLEQRRKSTDAFIDIEKELEMLKNFDKEIEHLDKQKKKVSTPILSL